MRLQGKVAVITGGAQGLGQAYALRFAREGAAVVVVDLRAEAAKDVERSIVGSGGRALAIAADVTDEGSAAAMARSVVERFGRIDVLVNNAAIYYDLDTGNQTIGYLRKVLDVNLIGVLVCSRAVFPYMKEQRGGSIINIASTAAFSRPGLSSDQEVLEIPSYAYGLSKSGVVYLTKSMARTLGRYHIRVNAIAPGATLTPATRRVVSQPTLDRLRAIKALGRNLEPEDLTGTAVFLASDESGMMTGQTMVVDGGEVMLG